MKILLLDPAGAFTDFGIKLLENGHEVRQWQKRHLDGSQSYIAKGILQRVINWEASMDWADLIFVTDNNTMTAVLNDPYLLLVDGRVSAVKDILPILEQTAQTNKPLVIISEDLDGEAMAALVVNKMRGTLKVAAVKAPAFGDRRKEILQDIAIITGGTVISEEVGLTLEKATISMLGNAEKIVINKDTTTIINGNGKKDDIKARVDLIKSQIDSMVADLKSKRNNIIGYTFVPNA